MSKYDVDYSNTIIYKIYCKDENIQDVYVGHTTNFVQRKKAHMSSCMKSNYSNHNCKLYQVIRNNGGWDNWQMMIVAFYNCKDLYEARQKEQYHYIELKATLNSVKPMKSEYIHLKRTKCNKSKDECKSKDEINDKFVCVSCDFRCSKRSNYNTHLLTHKHKKITEDTKNASQQSTSFICPCCNKKYSHLSGLCRHKKICVVAVKQDIHEAVTTNTVFETKPSDDSYPIENMKITPAELQNMITDTQFCKKMVVELIKTNNNLQAQILEMMKNTQSQSIETIPPPSTIGVASNGNNNTINANTTNNSNNPTFNMNLFLNEKCKDAMNMKDFVNSIQLNMTDLENVGRLGYVEGMSNIFIDNLQKTDVYKRPVHCSDVKRETLYVKEDDQWEREGPDHAKMTNAVLAVEHKNVVLVNEWAKANPRCLNSNTRENETYFRLSKAATDGEKDGNIDKVIRKVAKRVVIEKDNLKVIEDS